MIICITYAAGFRLNTWRYIEYCNVVTLLSRVRVAFNQQPSVLYFTRFDYNSNVIENTINTIKSFVL